MPEESTTPDLVELTRRQIEAVNRRDLDALLKTCAPDGVYDTGADGLGLFEGPAADAVNGSKLINPEWLTSDVEFEQPDELGGGEGVYHGPEGFARGTQQLLDVFEDFRADPEEFLDAGQHIVAYVRLSGRARDSGVPFDDPYTHLVRFRGEQIDLGHAYSDRREALKAVGLSE